jgi:hypothetical protein
MMQGVNRSPALFPLEVDRNKFREEYERIFGSRDTAWKHGLDEAEFDKVKEEARNSEESYDPSKSVIEEG